MNDAHRLSVPVYCDAFEPARKLSESFGFVYGAPCVGSAQCLHAARALSCSVHGPSVPLPAPEPTPSCDGVQLTELDPPSTTH